jgi:Mg2+/Co2+ transporter CorB
MNIYLLTMIVVLAFYSFWQTALIDKLRRRIEKLEEVAHKPYDFSDLERRLRAMEEK